MCGILGTIQPTRSVDLSEMERARDILSHRGPDGVGLWTDELRSGDSSVVLAHRRLSILDLSPAGSQPLLASESRAMRPATLREHGGAPYALVYNGEIYNYVELRDELRTLGIPFASHCDTEVLLASYIAWGADCLQHLNGMFAFAIWDTRNQRLFCARDRFGEKPFFYLLRPDDGLFAFASEIKALAALGLTSGELNHRAVYRYFRFNDQAGSEETVWTGIRQLLPSHWLSVEARQGTLSLTSGRYWQVPTADAEASDRDAIDGFRALFRDSVRIRLRSDVPLGTSLSGGLDSSSVLCEVRELGAASGQKAFSARMSDPSIDEGQFREAVLRQTGVRGFEVVPTAGAFLDRMDELFFAQEEPFPSTSMFASFLVSELAKKNGVVVLLDGQGADEYLAGYAHYPALVLASLARRGQFLRWRAERARLKQRVGADPVPPRAYLHHWVRGLRNGGSTLAVDPTLPVEFLDDGLRAQYRNEAPRTAAADHRALKARLRADLMEGHLQDLLRYADRNSMAFSRELRLPFLDHRLVEYCLRLPERLLYRDAESKWILRRAMRGTVPDEILDRRDKVGFVTPWREWWGGPSSVALNERLDAAVDELSGVVAPTRVEPGSAAALGVLALAEVRRRFRGLNPHQGRRAGAARQVAPTVRPR